MKSPQAHHWRAARRRTAERAGALHSMSGAPMVRWAFGLSRRKTTVDLIRGSEGVHLPFRKWEPQGGAASGRDDAAVSGGGGGESGGGEGRRNHVLSHGQGLGDCEWAEPDPVHLRVARARHRGKLT